MLLAFDELRQHSFCLSGIKVIHQKPVYRVLHMNKRPCNGFLYVLHGSCHYAFEGGEFDLSEGAVAYLPLGSKHTLTIQEGDFQIYRIDFTLHIHGDVVYFSDRPLKLTDEAPPECVEAISALESDYGLLDNTVVKTEKLCTVLAALQKATVSANQKRLMPAVRFLQEHTTGHIDCRQLAALCFLGTSRFYDLFRREFGITPLEYRDRLILRRATALLAAGDVSVKEAAAAVGFDNAAYFSRFFKKHLGLSPTDYIDTYKAI